MLLTVSMSNMNSIVGNLSEKFDFFLYIQYNTKQYKIKNPN